MYLPVNSFSTFLNSDRRIVSEAVLEDGVLDDGAPADVKSLQFRSGLRTADPKIKVIKMI